jgi:two-component system, response regulator
MNTPIKILLVEDNPRDAEVTLRALRKRNLGNDVIHVKDGQQALDWLFGPNPDGREDGNLPKLVLLDLKLPKIDGLEVLKAIRSDPRTPVAGGRHDVIERTAGRRGKLRTRRQ